MYSVRQLKFGERAPPAMCALVHRYRELTLAFYYSVQSRAEFGRGLIPAQRVVAKQVHQPAIIQLDQRVRVKLLEPPADFGQLRLRAQRLPLGIGVTPSP